MIRRVDLLGVQETLSLEHVEVGAVERQDGLARRTDVSDRPEIERGIAPHEDLRVLRVPGQHRRRRLRGRADDGLVGAHHAEEDVGVLVHLGTRGLEPDRRTARADLEVHSRVEQGTGVRRGVRVDGAARPDQLVEESVVGLGPPVRLHDDRLRTHLRERRGSRRGRARPRRRGLSSTAGSCR